MMRGDTRPAGKEKGVSIEVTLEREKSGVRYRSLIVELIKYVLYESGMMSMSYDQLTQLHQHNNKHLQVTSRDIGVRGGVVRGGVRGGASLQPEISFLHSANTVFSSVTNILSNPALSVNQMLLLLGPSPNTNPKHALMLTLPPGFTEHGPTEHSSKEHHSRGSYENKSARELLHTLFLDDFLHRAGISATCGASTVMCVMIQGERDRAADYSSAGLVPCLSFCLTSLCRIGINCINCSVRECKLEITRDLEECELSIGEDMGDISGIEPFSPVVSIRDGIRNVSVSNGRGSERLSLEYSDKKYELNNTSAVEPLMCSSVTSRASVESTDHNMSSESIVSNGNDVETKREVSQHAVVHCTDGRVTGDEFNSVSDLYNGGIGHEVNACKSQDERIAEGQYLVTDKQSPEDKCLVEGNASATVEAMFSGSLIAHKCESLNDNDLLEEGRGVILCEEQSIAGVTAENSAVNQTDCGKFAKAAEKCQKNGFHGDGVKQDDLKRTNQNETHERDLIWYKVNVGIKGFAPIRTN